MNTDEYDFVLFPEKYGYNEFKVDYLHKDAIHSWQKCIYSNDKKSKLYFITIYEYLMNFHGESYHAYESDTQLYQKDTHNAMNVEFLNDWTIDSIEEQIKNIYENGNFEPYEVEN